MASSERRPAVFTIPPERGFLDDLACGLLQQAGSGDLALARSLVILPNRRAIRALTEAFVRLSEGRALLLPRMTAIGDLDAAEALGSFAEGLEGAGELAPAVAPLARRIALTRMLHGNGRAAADSFALAGQLAAALDTLEVEGKRAADLAELALGEGLQAHWETSLDALKVVMHDWPALLASRGQQDATRRRTLLLDALRLRWQQCPPAGAITMAGFSSAPPAVAALLGAAVQLPQGQVVLPGLDISLPPETWQLIAGTGEAPALETHPQHGFARLLAAMRVGVGEVQPWPHCADSAGSSAARTDLVRRAMAPARLMPDWQALVPAADALRGVQLLEAASPAEEALSIAIAMRQVVKHAGKTAALVTADRALAKRVRVQLARFEIAVDDSSGDPLSSLPPGSLIAALAQAAAERFAPVSLLGLLKHPLVHSGDGRLPWLGQVRALDRLVLRGLRPAAGLAGVRARIAHRATDEGAREARLDARGQADVAALLQWWQLDVAPPLAALDAAAGTPTIGLVRLLAALQETAEALAGEALWSGPAGRALTHRLEELQDCGADLLRITLPIREAPQIVHALLADVPVRPAFGRHPQLSIWGPLEARLQHADVIVLGGLNEGVWPGMPAPDPWLAPAVRRLLDLPGLARRTGLQAHDFVSAMGACEVLLTRSAREGEAPSVPSRFWQRLRAAAGDGRGGPILLPETADILHAARGLGIPGVTVRIARPAPVPPLAARPKNLSVTEVATLKADPFAFYARRIMQLSLLDPLDADPTGAERGSLVHAVMQALAADPSASTASAASVEALVDAAIATLGERPDIAALWRRRVLRMAQWVQQRLAEESSWQPAVIEERGRIALAGIGLSGKPDRIDSDGNTLRIIDYKTGSMPKVGKVAALYDTQLALLALLAEAGAFPAVAGQPVGRLEYWHLSGGKEECVVRNALGAKASLDDMRAHMAAAEADLASLVGGYLLGDRPFVAKLHPVYSRARNDFDQLARLVEWLDR